MPQANGHIGVSGKIEVNLEGKGNGAQPRRHSGGGGHGADLLPEGAHLIGDQHLFGKAHYKALHAPAGLEHALPAVHQLVLHRLVLDDRPGDQLGEQRHIRAHVEDVLLGLDDAPVHVDGVGHGLERIEADADGQSQPQRGNARVQEAVQVVDGEIRVLEEAQNAQIAHPVHDQHGFGGLVPSRVLKMADQPGVGVVKHRGEQHDEDILGLAPAVEHKAEQQQHGIACLAGTQKIDPRHHRQEDQQKNSAAEYHRVVLLWKIYRSFTAFLPESGTEQRSVPPGVYKPRRVRGADAAKYSNHFSGGVYVGKILLGRKCAQRARAVGRNPIGNEIEDFVPAYLTRSRADTPPARWSGWRTGC